MEEVPVGTMEGHFGIVEEVHYGIAAARSGIGMVHPEKAEAHYETAVAPVGIEVGQVDIEVGHSGTDHPIAETAEVVRNPGCSGTEVVQED